MIDIVITAIRRPDILEMTLDSFCERVLANFGINKFLINIDPFGGSEAEHKQCLSVVYSRFPDALIFEPENIGFGAAVKRIWENTEADYVFHMEDDWLALADITAEMVFSQFDQRTKVLSLMSQSKNWNQKHLFDYMKKRPWYFPVRRIDWSRPKFTTSPSFWEGDFMRKCAYLIDENYDPEKQFFSGVNRPLEQYVKTYRNKFLILNENENMMKDIGRKWSRENGISKNIINATSIWTTNEIGNEIGNESGNESGRQNEN